MQVDTWVADRGGRVHLGGTDHEVDRRELVTTAWWNEPYELSFCGVKLEAVSDHPFGDLFNATAELKAERCCIIRTASAVYLYVVGVLIQHNKTYFYKVTSTYGQ